MTMFGGSRYNVDGARGGAYQPINYVISQTADSTGTATFLFDAVALSNTWTLTINCAGAPDTARWTATTGGTNFGQFKGSNSWGPLQLQGGDRLQVSATGLIPGQLYQVAGYGYCNVVNEPDIIYPTAYADTVTSSTEQIYLEEVTKVLSGSGTINTIATIQTNPSYRNIYLILYFAGGTGGATLYTYRATGNTSGIVYAGTVVPYGGGVGSTIVNIPISAAVDTSVTITAYTSSPVGASYQIYIGADLADTTMGVYAISSLPVTPAQNTTTTPFYVEGVQGTAGNAIKITGEGGVVGSTPVPITNAYASPGLLTLSTGSSGATYQHELEYGGATNLSATTTSTSQVQILAAPASGYSYRIHSVNMFFSGTLSTTPVVGRFLSGGTGPAFATLCFPYFSTVYLGGLLTNTAINVLCSSTTSTTFSIQYDIVSTPTIA